MGNNQSTSLQTQTLNFTQHYSFVHQQLENSEQSEIKEIINNTTRQSYLLRQWNFIEKQHAQNLYESISLKTKHYHRNIVKISEVFLDEYNGICGNRFTVYAVMQKPQSSVKEEYQERQKIHKMFSQTELWIIMLQITVGLLHCQRNNSMLGSLSMKDVYVMDSVFKILDPDIQSPKGDISCKQLIVRKLGAMIMELGLMYKPKSISSLYCNKLQCNYSAFLAATVNKMINNYITLQGIHKYAEQAVAKSNPSLSFTNTNGHVNKQNTLSRNSSANYVGHDSFRTLKTIQQTLSKRPQSLLKDQIHLSTDDHCLKEYSQAKNNQHRNKKQNNQQQSKQAVYTAYNNRICYPQKQVLSHKKQYQQIPKQPAKLQNHQSPRVVIQDSNSKIWKKQKIRNINLRTSKKMKQVQIKSNKKLIYLKKKAQISSFEQFSANEQSIYSDKLDKQNNKKLFDQKEYRRTRQYSYSKAGSSEYEEDLKQLQFKLQLQMEKQRFHETKRSNDPVRNMINLKESKDKISPSEYPRSIQNSNISEQEDSSERNQFFSIPQLRNRLQKGLTGDISQNRTIIQVQQSQCISDSSHCKNRNLKGQDFKDDVRRESSHGSQSSQDGYQYVIEEYEGGSRYQGYKKYGKKEGIGKLCYQDGGMYQGQWENDQMNGFGKLYYQNGKLAFQGYWKNNEFHGKGRIINDSPTPLSKSGFDFRDFNLINEGWVSYEGQFVEDIKSGQGVLKLSNGQIMQGNWQDNCVNGQCVFYTAKGDVIRGIWQENLLVQLLEKV